MAISRRLKKKQVKTLISNAVRLIVIDRLCTDKDKELFKLIWAKYSTKAIIFNKNSVVIKDALGVFSSRVLEVED